MSKSRGKLKKDGRELTALRSCVESTMGHTMATSNDFVELSERIQTKIHEYVSVNTLKRIWNFIDDGNVPSVTTLSLLARFLDFKNWEAFLVHLDHTATSQEFLGKGIRSNSLKKGDRLKITWEPNRQIVIMYTGSDKSRFRFYGSCARKRSPGFPHFASAHRPRLHSVPAAVD